MIRHLNEMVKVCAPPGQQMADNPISGLQLTNRPGISLLCDYTMDHQLRSTHCGDSNENGCG